MPFEPSEPNDVTDCDPALVALRNGCDVLLPRSLLNRSWRRPRAPSTSRYRCQLATGVCTILASPRDARRGVQPSAADPWQGAVKLCRAICNESRGVLPGTSN